MINLKYVSIFLTMFLGLAPSAYAQVTSGNSYQITSTCGDGTKALTVHADSTLENANIELATRLSTRNSQIFKFETVMGGYKITARNSLKSFEIAGKSSQSGAALVQYSYTGTNSQIFKILSTTIAGIYQFQNANSGFFLDVVGGSTVDGTKIVQYGSNSTCAQKFKLVPVAAVTTAIAFGTYKKPFSAGSPWNSKPLTYTLGTDVIPSDIYAPAINGGSYSTSFYEAKNSDGPVTFYSVLDQEYGATPRNVVIPHWPAGSVPATGSDGHLDVFDSTTGIIHSFWKARIANGVWTASLYAWEKINGTGFGDPAHYYKGARAAGVPTSAGIIRAHEHNDGKDQYSHALTISLAFAGLSPLNNGYIFPATSADGSYYQNYGKFPEGSLLMLPKTFDLTKISNVGIRKVAKTLMTYGAYVVDRNSGTPFAMYQEIGTPQIAGWANLSDTDQIRAGLRKASVTTFVDGNGISYQPSKKLNILSMRGNFNLKSGTVASKYDPYNQQRIWGPSTSQTIEEFYSPRSRFSLWSNPVAGQTFKVVAKTSGGAYFGVKVIGTTTTYYTGRMANGETRTFVWTSGGGSLIITVISGVGASSSASGTVTLQ